MCSSGSLQGVLAGSHYNRAWVVHTAFSEALERLLYERFLEEYNVTLPQIFSQLTDDTYIKYGSDGMPNKNSFGCIGK